MLGLSDNTVWIWDTDAGMAARKLLRGHGTVNKSVSLCGQRIMPQDFLGNARAWDVKTGMESEVEEELRSMNRLSHLFG